MMDKVTMNADNKEQIVKTTSEEHNDAIALMRGFMDSGNPKVGIFWYDYVNNILFGVEKGDVE